MARQESVQRSLDICPIEQALASYRTGKLDHAARICDAILAVDPLNFDALHLSGMVRHQLGRPAEALRLVAAALKAKPGSAEALANYGVVLEALERYEEALTSYDRVLAMPAGDATLHYNRGNALRKLGRLTEALESYDRSIGLAPDLAVAHHGRGFVLTLLERHEEALTSFDRVIALTSVECRARRNGNLPPAADPAPERAPPDKGSCVDSQHAAAWLDRAKTLMRLKRFEEALGGFDRVLALRPDDADVFTNRGTVLAELGRYDEALAAFADALRIDPNFFHAHLNRGNVYGALTRMDQALASYAAACALNPEDPDANFNTALARLCIGDFHEGWRRYEYRLKRQERLGLQPSFPRPIWRGEKNLHGKTIALVAEQGMGDAIQFVRYAPLVAAFGAKVLLGVHRPLARLTETVSGVAHVIPAGGTFPDFDLYCLLPSLPLAFGTEPSTIPSKVPYIRPEEERIARWRRRLPRNGALRVGICWAGSSAHVGDRRRSMTLEQFATILSVSGIDFISLQKEVSESQSALLRDYGVTQFGQEFQDFSDTAAVVAQLDLVISVDTSVAHLAGAMAKAVAVLLAFSPDWRWMLDRTDTPWYPTMRLFRQPAPGDWATPLEQIRRELAALVAPARAPG